MSEKQRNQKTGQFIFSGGKKAELRDKKCSYCPKLIMRKSSSCRSCHQKGSKSHLWKDAKPTCPTCGIKKTIYSKGLCRNCFKGKNHFAWKTDVGYTSLHDWVRRYLGKPSYCTNGHVAKRYVWANKSGEYKRDLLDWHSLCDSCNIMDGIKMHTRFKKEVYINV